MLVRIFDPSVFFSRKRILLQLTGEIWGNTAGERPTQKDERMMKMVMKRKTPFGMFDIRLSQSTCKISETETNANRLDLPAKKKEKKS